MTFVCLRFLGLWDKIKSPYKCNAEWTQFFTSGSGEADTCFCMLTHDYTKGKLVSLTSLFGELFISKSSSPEKLVDLLELCIYSGMGDRDVSQCFFFFFFSGLVIGKIRTQLIQEKGVKIAPPLLLKCCLISTSNVLYLKIFGWVYFPLRKTR